MVQAALPVAHFWLPIVILWPATCCALFGSRGEAFVIIGNCEHRDLGFGVVHLLRESASFLGAVEPMLGIVNGCDGH
jgi:hypothetical protein